MRVRVNPTLINVGVDTGICDAHAVPIAEFLANPGAFQYTGIAEFFPEAVPPSPLEFEEIARRYAELEARISKKLVNAFVEVDLHKGQGVESQLAFRRDSRNGACVAWSPRAIRSDSLEMGTILHLGYPSRIGHESCAMISATIETSAGIETLAGILSKKMR